MSWDELQTRVRQEVSKRLDATLYGMGVQPGRNGLKAAPATAGKFFFTASELPGRIALLRDRLPGRAAAIVAEADQALEHRFRLLGYHDLDYGRDIDWHLDAVHDKRAPLIPWYRIDFLDFEQVGDHKVTWELSRHQHLVTLAKAWLLTGNSAYTNEIFAQWHSWQRANPYPLGAHWASSLELAFRSLSWIWVHQLLSECPAVPAQFHNDLLPSLSLHGRHIERYLSTYFSPNTHLLGEAVALFFIGTLYPQISSAGRWAENGWRIIQEEAIRQVRPDGVYFEQSLYYHVYALDFFLHARLLASCNGIEVSPEYDDILRRMLSVVQSLSAAGPPDGFGDDDGGRLFDSSRNRAEYMTDPLAIGSALFANDNFHAPLSEEAIWLFGDKAMPKTHAQSALNSHAFPDGGLYIIQSDQPARQQIVVDAGPQGTGRSGHGHADALSVKLTVAGQRLLVDAGSYYYIGPGSDRDLFRGTRAHNTLTVDGLDQAQAEGPFAWGSLPDVKVDSWITGAHFTLFAGSHSGYERLPHPVRHHRFVFHLHGSFCVIRDVAEGDGQHLLETSWHFAPDIAVSERGRGFLACPSTIPSGSSDLAFFPIVFFPIDDPRWRSRIVSEYVSPAYGERVNAPVVRCSGALTLPAEHSVLLAAAMEAPAAFSRDQQPTGALASVYRYQVAETTHLIIFAGEHPWEFGPWSSDARFLYLRVTDQHVTRLILGEGSSIRFHDQTVLSHPEPLQWLEWTNRDGNQEFLCPDDSARDSFHGDLLSSMIERPN